MLKYIVKNGLFNLTLGDIDLDCGEISIEEGKK